MFSHDDARVTSGQREGMSRFTTHPGGAGVMRRGRSIMISGMARNAGRD